MGSVQSQETRWAHQGIERKEKRGPRKELWALPRFRGWEIRSKLVREISLPKEKTQENRENGNLDTTWRRCMVGLNHVRWDSGVCQVSLDGSPWWVKPGWSGSKRMEEIVCTGTSWVVLYRERKRWGHSWKGDWDQERCFFVYVFVFTLGELTACWVCWWEWFCRRGNCKGGGSDK